LRLRRLMCGKTLPFRSACSFDEAVPHRVRERGEASKSQIPATRKGKAFPHIERHSRSHLFLVHLF
jgi:hypothetical protein